ncbi:MAG: ERF family protein [Mailhella sp.]|nr:ERF family protein [Mailhella sp.]
MCNFSSETITTITKALLSAQEQLRPITKDAENPFLRNRYASLPAVLDMVRRPLLDNNVLLIQRVVQSEPGTAAVETRLVHSSGEWIAGVTTIPLPDVEPGAKVNFGQAVGAAISYARRYGLMAMLSMAAVDDDTDCEIRAPQQRQAQPMRQDNRHDFVPPARQVLKQATPQAAQSNTTGKTAYPGLPELNGVTYENSTSDSGKPIVIAKGQTILHKDALKNCGFRWNPDKRVWAQAI